MILDNEYIHIALNALAYLGAAFVLFFIGRKAYGLFHPKVKVAHELVEKDNLAFALSYVGYLVGLIIAIGGAVVGESNGLINDLIAIGIYGLLAIVLLNLSKLLNDNLILHKFSINKEILEDQNAGTGIVEAANSIVSGLIIFGAVSGDGSELGFGIFTAITFWVLGQIIMVITSRIYNAMTPYDIHEYIEKDNVAVGIGFAGALIAIGNLIRFGLEGDFISWQESLLDVGFEVIVGLAFLPLARIVTDKILLPGRKLTDEIINQEHPNQGAAIIEAFAYIGGSVLITWCL